MKIHLVHRFLSYGRVTRALSEVLCLRAAAPELLTHTLEVLAIMDLLKGLYTLQTCITMPLYK